MSNYRSNMAGYKRIDDDVAKANINKAQNKQTNKFFPWYKERLFQYPGEVSKIIFTLDNVFNPNNKDYGLPYTYDCTFVMERGFDKFAKWLVPSPSVIGETCPIQTRFLKELPVMGKKSQNGDEYIARPLPYFNLSAFQYDKSYKLKSGEVRKYKNPNVPIILSLLGEAATNKDGKVLNEIHTFEILELLKTAYNEVNPKTKQPYHSIDGVEIWLKRSDAQLSPTVGRPIPVANTGKLYIRRSKELLLSKFGHEQRVSKAGNVYAEKDSDIYQVDINKVFFTPTEKNICELFGLTYTVPMGSGDNDMDTSSYMDYPESEIMEPDTFDDSPDFDQEDIPFDDGLSDVEVTDDPNEATKGLSDDELMDIDELNLDDDIPF